MRLHHEIAIFQTVKSKVIISLFETVRLSVSISLRNLYNSLNSIKEIFILRQIYSFFSLDADSSRMIVGVMVHVPSFECVLCSWRNFLRLNYLLY